VKKRLGHKYFSQWYIRTFRSYLLLLVRVFFFVRKTNFKKIVEWSGRQSTAKGNRGKAETPKRSEDA
jgi:hypothetical protein